jgi:hypothetical protein
VVLRGLGGTLGYREVSRLQRCQNFWRVAGGTESSLAFVWECPGVPEVPLLHKVPRDNLVYLGGYPWVLHYPWEYPGVPRGTSLSIQSRPLFPVTA